MIVFLKFNLSAIDYFTTSCFKYYFSGVVLACDLVFDNYLMLTRFNITSINIDVVLTFVLPLLKFILVKDFSSQNFPGKMGFWHVDDLNLSLGHF